MLGGVRASRHEPHHKESFHGLSQQPDNLATLGFMQRDVFDSRVAALYLIGALIPFVIVAVAARLAAVQRVAIAIMVASGLFTLGGTAFYWYYFRSCEG